MTLPKWLEEKRESAADHYTDEVLLGASIDEEHVHTAHKAGFNACAEILLPEMKLLVDELARVQHVINCQFGSEMDVMDLKPSHIAKALARWKERFPDG